MGANFAPLVPPMNELRHTTIANRYRIQEQVGRGGMSDVYRAYDLCRDTLVAIT